MFKIVHCCFFGVVGDAIALSQWPALASAFNFLDPAVLCSYPFFCAGIYDGKITLPNSLGLLSNLVWLHRANNNISGNIPDSLGRLSNLALLYLEFNNLSGIIPRLFWTVTEPSIFVSLFKQFLWWHSHFIVFLCLFLGDGS
jgi:hypothetical protein